MGNPFLRNYFETKDGRYVVPSAVYVDLAYQWSAFLSCSMCEKDVREAFKKRDSTGELLPEESNPPRVADWMLTVFYQS